MGSEPKRAAALVGNPNTGKTTLFNALSGLRQRVGNYPGVTVETKKGQMCCGGQPFELIDLPGTYSLSPRSPDEMVAVDVILGRQKGEVRPDVVVSIVDASNLERNLYLTTQALELGVPVVLALNMIDVAAAQGIRIDVERLSRQLGVPVVAIQANKKKGLEQLRDAIAQAACGLALSRKRPLFPEAFEREIEQLHQALGPDVSEYLVRRLVLDVGGWTEQRLVDHLGEGIRQQVQSVRERLAQAGCPVPAVEARARYGWIREVTAGCVERPAERPVTWTDRIDRVLTHKFWGTLIFLAVMFLVFQAIFTWARPLMKGISDAKDALADLLRGQLPPGPFTNLLLDGILEGVGAVVIFLPQILILFAFIAVLEDCGYMARAAFLMDKLMSRCGLSGKSFIPMLSSIACAVPGILATRVIENRRDRLATILVAPLMSCSARLPVYILLIGAFLTGPAFAWWLPGVVMFAMYAIGLVLAPLVALLLKRTLLRGETPVFVMEMPLYKLPSPRLILRRMLDSGWAFLRRAGTLILASVVVVWALLYFPRGGEAEQQPYDVRLAAMQQELDTLKEKGENEAAEAKEQQINSLTAEWKQQSYLGRMGKAIEPVVRPLGWDWKIGVAALASFPAREVVVGTLGIIYSEGEQDTDAIREAKNVADLPLAKAMQKARWDDDPARPVFTIPTVLSLLVFFALCCQCVSTLAVIKRETRSWRWPVFTFTYMTALAYVGALVVYQAGRFFGG
ncbi:MAG TPA: ferrous iron transport protein B [Gemmataceae bacterium]|nr:ferrous iron transport protein B [Gemmataceae bacterium]